MGEIEVIMLWYGAFFSTESESDCWLGLCLIIYFWLDQQVWSIQTVIFAKMCPKWNTKLPQGSSQLGGSGVQQTPFEIPPN